MDRTTRATEYPGIEEITFADGRTSFRVAYKAGDKRRYASVSKHLGRKNCTLEDAVALQAELSMAKPSYGTKSIGVEWVPSERWIRQTRLNLLKRDRAEHVLSETDLRGLCDRSQGICELTGMPFRENSKRHRQGHMLNPFSPSVDRINSRSGYTADNCRLVCLCVNLALNQWGDEVFDTMARAYVTQLLNKPALPANP